MPFQISQKRRTLLPTRVVIYLIVLLAVAWVLWRYDQNVQQEQSTQNQVTTATAPAAAEKETLRPADATPRGPMLVLLGKSDDDLGKAGKLAKELLENRGISVVRMTSDAPEDLEILKKSFDIPPEQTEFPIAILFSSTDQELARILPPITSEKLQTLLLPQK
jgi:hypothetical protein